MTRGRPANAGALILGQRPISLSQFSKVGMLEDLASRHTVIIVINEQVCNDFLALMRDVRNELCDAGALLPREVELHVRGDPLELFKQFWCWSAKYVVNFVNLVKLIVAWKERKECQYFKVDASNAPIVHLVIVVAISEQALGRPVPPRRDVLRERWLRVDTPARAKVCQLHLIVLQQNVLRLDVSMEDAVPVHVVDRLENLVHVELDALLWQVVPPPLYRLIHVHVHQFEDEG